MFVYPRIHGNDAFDTQLMLWIIWVTVIWQLSLRTVRRDIRVCKYSRQTAMGLTHTLYWCLTDNLRSRTLVGPTLIHCSKIKIWHTLLEEASVVVCPRWSSVLLHRHCRFQIRRYIYCMMDFREESAIVGRIQTLRAVAFSELVAWMLQTNDECKTPSMPWRIDH